MNKKYKFAVLGKPVAHSLSPEIHRIFAEGCGIDIDYEKIETNQEQLGEVIEYLKRENYSGFNCTMPLKSEIIKYLDVQDGQCEFLDVCNTVKIDNGKLYGFTTDGGGMTAGLKYNGVQVEGKNILIFGAGASARAVTLSLIKNNARDILILNRSKDRLDDMRGLFKNYADINYDLLTLDNIKKYIASQDILINMSSMGMSGFDEGLDYDFLKLMKRSAVIADAVYSPLDTRLLKAARENNLKIIDGFWMLVYQGVLAFEIWTGLKVPEASIEKAHGVIER